MMRRIAVPTILMMFAGVVHGQETLTGTWQGETRSGTPIVLTLSVKGTALTGTLVRDDQSTPIADGKASNNKFTFKATVNETSEGFSGELVNDEIKIWLDRQGPSSAISLRRAKQAVRSRGSVSWAKAF